MGALLCNGELVPVPGVTVIGPHDAAWSHLNAGDGVRRTRKPSMVILHKTKADDPEKLLPGQGPGGRCQRVAEYWDGDPKHSGAQIVIDGWEIACLADLWLFEAWHGNMANLRSIGIEHCEEAGGLWYQGTLDNAVALYPVLAMTFGIQLQFPRIGTYHGKPLARFVDGGSTLVGFFGHRDVTSERGRWDPGDIVFLALEHLCRAEPFDFAAAEDRDVWVERQHLLARNHDVGTIDGIPGQLTTAALRAEGYVAGIWALGKSPG